MNVEEDSIRPTQFTDNVQQLCPSFEPSQQQDAYEFLTALLRATATAEANDIQNQELGIENVPLNQVVMGKLRRRLTCQACDSDPEVRERIENFAHLALPVQVSRSGRSVDLSLSSITSVKNYILDCSRCEAPTVFRGREVIRCAPNVLILNLQRFEVKEGRVCKTRKKLDFPQKLDLAPYMDSEYTGGAINYSLKGLVEHRGASISSGHYVAFVEGRNEWLLKNDQHTSSVSISEVLKRPAYLLFYMRDDVPGAHLSRRGPRTKRPNQREEDNLSDQRKRDNSPKKRKRAPAKAHKFNLTRKQLAEIRKYQSTTTLLMRKGPFSRVVREIAQDFRSDLRFKNSALIALQAACEDHITDLLEYANHSALHAKRVTIMPKDISLVRRLRGEIAHHE